MTRKKRLLFPALVLILLACLVPPTHPQETAPAKVSVAVRVVDGARFVGGLGREDFEVLENGVPQKIGALYEVDKNAVTRQEGESPTPPVTARKFHLLFQMYEYNPKVHEAITYFFNNALLPGDTLTIQTPVKSYRLTPEAFAQKPRDVLAKEMDQIVRKDINAGNFVYKGVVRDLRRIAQGIEGGSPAGEQDSDTAAAGTFGVEYLVNTYRDSLRKLEELQAVDQDKMLGFAQALKKQDGRKLVFFIYQQEFRPTLSNQAVSALIDTNQDNQNLINAIHDLFQMYHENISLDYKKIIEAYCDSSADLNFLFMTKTPERIGGITMRDQSEGVFKVFSQVAKATGGISVSTQNPVTQIQDALKASESYYLLDYTPAPAANDGTFKTITVKVKGKDYKVFNRQGYITN